MPENNNVCSNANEGRAEVDAVLPLPKMMTLGLQHVLAMYAGAVAVPLMLSAAVGLSKTQTAFLISADLFTCGIATLLQTHGLGPRIGIRLPLMMGVTMVALGPMLAIAREQGLQYVYGAIIISGIVATLCAGAFSRILRFFPEVVTGCVVTIVGVNLFPIAVQWAGGGQGAADYGSPGNLLLATGTLALVTALTRWGGRFISSIAVLISLIAGSAVALFLGRMSLTGISTEPWLALPVPFWFGPPKFHLTAVLNMLCVAAICMVESTGVFFSMGKITHTQVSGKDVAAGLRAEGIASVIGGALNSFPYITFSQNLGLVALTGVKSRYVLFTGGLILMFLGTLPKLAAVAASIPAPVLGGAALALFGMVAGAGIKLLACVDYEKQGNLFTVAVSLGLGIGINMAPQMFASYTPNIKHFIGNGLLVGSGAAIFLNWLFSERK
ncbi:MAG: nucleobase:cation symporter-2 family protein [Elusimicrobiaceae bacterium]